MRLGLFLPRKRIESGEMSGRSYLDPGKEVSIHDEGEREYQGDLPRRVLILRVYHWLQTLPCRLGCGSDTKYHQFWSALLTWVNS